MASLIPYDPLVDTGIDELFRGFFQPIRMEGRAAPVTIKMDVTEDDKSYTVHAEIPGVSKDDIQVTIEGNQVTLGAEVKREKEVKDGQRVLRRALLRQRAPQHRPADRGRRNAERSPLRQGRA